MGCCRVLAVSWMFGRHVAYAVGIRWKYLHNRVGSSVLRLQLGGLSSRDRCSFHHHHVTYCVVERVTVSLVIPSFSASLRIQNRLPGFLPQIVDTPLVFCVRWDQFLEVAC
uniref:Putative secreted protein n=1 Tax=Ixodes ricinus TaxID=34613 RepID=A0A6B0UJF7_IXORI